MKVYKLVMEKSRLNLRKMSLEQSNFGMAGGAETDTTGDRAREALMVACPQVQAWLEETYSLMLCQMNLNLVFLCSHAVFLAVLLCSVNVVFDF